MMLTCLRKRPSSDPNGDPYVGESASGGADRHPSDQAASCRDEDDPEREGERYQECAEDEHHQADHGTGVLSELRVAHPRWIPHAPQEEHDGPNQDHDAHRKENRFGHDEMLARVQIRTADVRIARLLAPLTDWLSDTSAATPKDADHSDDDDDDNGRNDEPYRHGHAVLRTSAAGRAGEQKQD